MACGPVTVDVAVGFGPEAVDRAGYCEAAIDDLQSLGDVNPASGGPNLHWPTPRSNFTRGIWTQL